MTLPVPGPQPRPVVGTLPYVDGKRPLQSHLDNARKYGEIFAHHFPGRPPTYFVSSRRLVDELCDETRFDKRVHASLENIRAFAGDGLFTARTDEEDWGKAHRILMPAFSPVALKQMFDDMTDPAEQLMLKWERLGPDADIDVGHDFTRLTLDTIALCSFSYRFNSFYSESMHPFVDAMVEALEESGRQGRRLPVQNRLMRAQRRRYEENIRVMHEVADQLIAQRRAEPLPDGRHDILDTMLQAKDPQTGETLSDENVRHQMVTFLIAGHETTSNMLTFVLYELISNPEVTRTAREQVDRVLDGRFPEYRDLPELGYLDQILRETLRMWPPAPAFGVHPFEPTTIGGEDGYAVSPDQTVLVLTPALHRDPEAWEDPDRFDPDRFSFERAKDIPPNAWKPFGNGQRSCIGRGFALQEAQLVLALLLQRFDFTFADPAYELSIKETITLKPDNMLVRLTPRRDRPRASRPHPDATAEPAATALPRVESHGTPLQVLFGSNAGTAEAFAQQLARTGTALGYEPTVAPLDDGVDALTCEGVVLVVTASYEGQPPDNAKRFLPWLEGLDAGALSDRRFAVFGCGNTDWARTYQRIPTLVDDQLARAGAQRVAERGAANARGDFFGDFDAWSATLWPALAQELGLEPASEDAAAAELTVDVLGPVRESVPRPTDLGTGILVANRELVDTSGPGARSTRHFEIALPAGQTYRPGDYLELLPLNPPALVDRALRRFDLVYDTGLRISGQATHVPVDTAVPAGELFASYVELSRPAGRRQIERLAQACPCPPERDELTRLGEPEAYEAQVLDRRVSVLDLLERYPSIDVSLATFVSMLTGLAPRRYSISSSPRWREDHVTLTVARVQAPAFSGQGVYEGVASSFLTQSRPGTPVPVAVRPSNVAFCPPQDLSVPVVMICAGSGLAPFRGFVQDRALRAQDEGVTPAPALLFFGCRARDADLLYADEFAAWQGQGIVDVRPTFSREPQEGPDGPMRYVQDRLWAERGEVAELVRAGAQVFVCGDGRRMAPAVHDTCARIYAEAQGVDHETALEWMTAMEQEHGRYVSDVFA